MDYQKIVYTSLFRRLQGSFNDLGQVHLFGFLLKDLIRQDRPDFGVINKST